MRYPKFLTQFFLFSIRMDRYLLMIAFSLISISCSLGPPTQTTQSFPSNKTPVTNQATQSAPKETPMFDQTVQSFPSKEVSLPDWGLSHPSQIGYLSIGILHKKKGDEIVLYDIRERKPTLKIQEGPRGRVPSFEGDFFLVSHFTHGNINRLGGYFNGFARHPSKSTVSISKTSDDLPALTYSFENQSPGFSGFWIHFFDFKAPPSEQVLLDATPFIYLTFSIRGKQGNEKIMLRMADRSLEKKEDSSLIGEVSSFLPDGKIKEDWQTAWVPLSKLNTRINKKELANVVFQAAGDSSGEIFIRNLAFAKKKGVSLSIPKSEPVQSCSSNKAMWLWETNKILRNPEEQKTFFDFCKEQQITDLFVQIPYEAEKREEEWIVSWDSAEMRPLLAKLNRADIKVHALDGDPRFALKEWHGRSIALLEKIIQYNQSVSTAERFHGIRYDNEPYLLPQFGGVHKESVLKEYIELAEKSQALAQQGGLVFGVDIPFWFDGYNEFFEPSASLEGRPMSERIIDVVDNVGIMDYRTIAYGADGVIEHGTNELKYAAKKGKQVFIGLETVWLPDETIYSFTPHGSGSRTLIETLDSKRIRITFVPKGKSIDPQGGLFLYQTRQVQVPASKLTFNQKKPKDLEEVMRHSEQELCQFPSFHGFVIHSYESFRPWLEK
jgi:hypothetical protein